MNLGGWRSQSPARPFSGGGADALPMHAERQAGNTLCLCNLGRRSDVLKYHRHVSGHAADMRRSVRLRAHPILSVLALLAPSGLVGIGKITPHQLLNISRKGPLQLRSALLGKLPHDRMKPNAHSYLETTHSPSPCLAASPSSPTCAVWLR
jgi:hypothetical protein